MMEDGTNIKAASCEACGWQFEYSEDEVRSGYDFTIMGTIQYEYVICPSCGHKIQFIGNGRET